MPLSLINWATTEFDLFRLGQSRRELAITLDFCFPNLLAPSTSLSTSLRPVGVLSSLSRLGSGDSDFFETVDRTLIRLPGDGIFVF